MAAQNSPFVEATYGWPYGSNGWDGDMNTNLVKFSYLHDRNIDAIVSSLPAIVNGKAYFNTADNRLYFDANGQRYSTVTPKWFEVTLRTTGQVYQFDGTTLNLGTTETAYTDTLRSDLADDADPVKGANQIGHKNRDVGDILDDVVNIISYGALPLLGDIGPAYQQALDYAASTGKRLVIPAGEYNQSTPVILSSASILNSTGVSIEGLGSYRTVKINYTGTGFALSYVGSGDEGNSPITRFTVKNLWIYGNDNTSSDGGFYFERCYIGRLQDCSSSGWAKATANALAIQNAFNFEVSGGNYSNGFPLPTGGAVVRVGSLNPSAWNTSNIIFRNTLIQRGEYGILVDHDSNILDNLCIDNVSFGSNKKFGVFSNVSTLNNVSIKNCHFEGAGQTGTPTPFAGSGHISLTACNSVDIGNNSFQDALTYITLDSVRAFDIGRGNKFFETGFYTLTGNTLLKIRTTTGNCLGYWGANEVRTDQIDTLFDFTESGGFRVDMGRQTHTMTVESNWNTEIFTNPLDYKGTIVDRYQSTNAPFDRMVSDGTTWYRYMLTSMYKGERTSIPSTTEGAGSFYLKKNPVVSGTAGSQYIITGWITTGGGTWHEERSLTGT